ncbi:MAG: formate dehydrogenase accessory sulfurtransferase FdhD [Actinobacteria bacterium]|nr:formate dehydrogenase accessory sulfurtransferase FdhD [Actinomycetota bacterium]
MELEERTGLQSVSVTRYQQGERRMVDDVVAREVPLEVRFNGRTLARLMRLPGDEVLLAAGHCLSEGLISDREQLEFIRHRCGGYPEPFGERPSGGEGEGGPREPATCDLVEVKARTRPGAGREGTGGEADVTGIRVDSEARFPPGVIEKAPGFLIEGQEVFRATGGTHAAGIFNAAGEILVIKEDIGRYSAVDKALGHLLLSGEPASDKGIVLSGRLFGEMVLKCARAGIPLVCSISAPTARGVEVGRETGVTLVGFLRGSSFNVYSHPERIGAP